MDWLALISDTAVARVMTRLPVLYILASSAHIMAIGALFGSVLVLDLRLLGLFPQMPLGPSVRILSRVAAIGLAAAMATGVLLFLVRPGEYLENMAFLAKLALVPWVSPMPSPSVGCRPGGRWRRAARHP